ncbi:MAG: hypothetical protein ACQKBV_03215 [Puniceicoccales bacterium]
MPETILTLRAHAAREKITPRALRWRRQQGKVEPDFVDEFGRCYWLKDRRAPQEINKKNPK